MSIKLWQALLLAVGWIGADVVRLVHGHHQDGALVIAGCLSIAIFCAGLTLVAALNRWLS